MLEVGREKEIYETCSNKRFVFLTGALEQGLHLPI